MFITNRLFNLQDNFVNEIKNIVILKAKDLSSKIDENVNILWSCDINIEQIKIVQIFILISIAKSNYIVFVSIFYFHDKRTMIYLITIKNVDKTFWSIRTIWTIHQLFAFSFELFSCMLSLTKFEIVLSNLYVFVFKDIDCWYIDFWLRYSFDSRKFNEYMNVIYNVSCSKRFSLSILMFKIQSYQKVMKLIYFIYFDFQKHSRIWKFEFLSMCSIFDDFKFIHLDNNNMIYVKIKNNHCKMKYDDKKRIRRIQYYQKSINFTNRQMFNWKVFWNFIWIIIDEKNQTFFLSRDIIFRHWWNVFFFI